MQTGLLGILRVNVKRGQVGLPDLKAMTFVYAKVIQTS